MPDDMTSVENYFKNINDKQLARIEGEFASRIKKVYKKRDEKLIEAIKDSVYLFDNKVSGYIDNILSEIYKGNPSIDNGDYEFFVKNSIVPNASCYGDGFFEVNLGLLETLTSDDEIAFVLCHEIAHELLDHPLRNVTRGIEQLNSESTKKLVQNVKKKRYGRTRAALSIVDELSVDFLDHSRTFESQADSLGFILYQNTRFNKANAISALKHLDVVDDVLFKHPVKIDSVFNFPSYPFKKFWLDDEVSLFTLNEKINDYKLSSDTLKTHPDVPFRMSKLIKEFQVDTSDFSAKGIYFEEMKDIVEDKSLKTLIDLKKYDLALYQLEKKHALNKISSDTYVLYMLSILKGVFFNKKKHQLGKYVPRQNTLSKEKEINVLRKLLHTLELKEIKAIGSNYYYKAQDELSENQIKKFNLFKE